MRGRDANLVVVDRLIEAGPMPLAQLARRARNSKTGAAVLQNAAHYLGEAGAALGAAYWLGRALRAHGRATPAMQHHLDSMLARGASFGGWVGLLRESCAAVPGDALASLSEPLTDGMALDALAEALGEAGQSLGEDGIATVRLLQQARRRGVLGFFDFLVAFRNKVYGHGTMLPEKVCRTLALPALASVAAVVQSEALLGGGWLGRTGADLLSSQDRRFWKRLHGISERIVDESAAQPDPAAVSPNRLFVVDSTGPVSLSFLVIQDEDASGLSRFGFFQRAAGPRSAGRPTAGTVQGADYLDFLSGRFRDDSARDELARALEATSCAPDAPGGDADSPLDGVSAEARRFGDFVISDELGRGAMGIVYSAMQPSLGRRVALKLLPPAFLQDPIALGRFHREVRSLARCDHPNVVRILASGVDSGRPWYAMELLDGVNLSQVKEAAAGDGSTAGARQALAGLGSGDREGFLRVALLFAQAARGLEEIHSRGLIHRDVKPANVMLTADGERLVLMDLGLAAAVDESAAWTKEAGSDFIGSARYAAPEQIQGRLAKVDHRADLYGLGATLWELCTSTPLYPSDTIPALLDAKLRQDPPSARSLRSAVPRDLDTILQKCLARRAEDRYRTAANLAEDLEAFAAKRPILARPPSAFDYLSLFYQRQRRAVQLGSATLLVLVVVASVGFGMVVRERRVALQERDRAEALAGFVTDELYDRLEPMGKLSLLDDVTERMAAHYRSGDLSDAHVAVRYGAALVRVGDVRRPQGKLNEAASAYEEASAVLAGARGTEQAQDERELWLARAAWGEARDRRTALAARSPALVSAQRDLAESCETFGKVSKAAGDLDGAVQEFHRAIELRTKLLQADLRSSALRKDAASAYYGLGDVLKSQGKASEALAAWRDGLALVEAISREHRQDASLQLAVAAGHSNIGKVLRSQGDLSGARGEYERVLGAMESLVAQDPSNADWQLDLAAAHNNVGAVLELLGVRDEALARFRKAISLAQSVSDRDPSNARWRSTTASLHENLGLTMEQRGDTATSLEEYQSALRITEELVKLDAANLEWQGDLAARHSSVGDVLVRQGRLEEAADEYRRAIGLLQGLADRDPSNAAWQESLATQHSGLGRALRLRGELTAARTEQEAGLSVLARLTDKDPSNADWKQSMAYVHVSIAETLRRAGQDSDAAKRHLDVALGLLEGSQGGPDDVWALRVRAWADNEVGLRLESKGARSDALAAQRRALDTAEKAIAAAPEDVDAQVMAARCKLALGRLLRGGAAADAAQGKALAQAALVVLERLASESRLSFAEREALDEARRQSRAR